MKDKEVIYYKFKKNYVWLVLNLLILYFLINCAVKHPMLWHWDQMQIMLGLFSTTLLMWSWKYLCKIPVAVISEESIKIDHCHPLAWKDIAGAQYRTAHCCFKKLPIIVLYPRAKLQYKYNFLQKMIIDSDFTAFSIPLYDISKEDHEKVAKLLTQYLGKIEKEEKKEEKKE